MNYNQKKEKKLKKIQTTFKLFIVLIFFLFFLSNAISEITEVNLSDLNQTIWSASSNITSDIRVVHKHAWLYNTKFDVELNFQAIEWHSYKVQHRIIAYYTIAKNCFWYDTLQVIDLNLNEVIAKNTKGFSSDCFGKPRYTMQFEDTTADFYWKEKIDLVKPEVKLTADKIKGLIPLTVKFNGYCKGLSKYATISSCEINYDGIKREFNEKDNYTFREPKEFTVSLTAIDSFGLKNSKSIKINALNPLKSKILSFNVLNATKEKTISLELECKEPTQAEVAITSIEGKVIEKKKVECKEKTIVTLKPVASAGVYIAKLNLENCEGSCEKEIRFVVGSNIISEIESGNMNLLIGLIFIFIIIITGLLVHERLHKAKKEKKKQKNLLEIAAEEKQTKTPKTSKK